VGDAPTADAPSVNPSTAETSDGGSTPVGFVGLGSIGRPMVESLLRAGVPTVVNDLDQAIVAQLVELGAEPAASLTELAERARLVGVCVPADEHVRAVLGGPDGLLARLPEGAVVAVHSTVLPETVLWADTEARSHGVAIVEAAVTGGFMAAAEGRSTFLLGGDPAVIEELSPMLDACGEVRVHAGELGQASRLKLCVNLQSYATFMGVCEAATLATRLDLPLDALKAAMRANGQLGELVETYLLLHEFSPETLADPGTRAALEGYAAIIEKDLDLIAALADGAGVPVPAAELAGRLARRVYFLEDPTG
jgi:3-hydroxyisobutyrate dehydrogenase-like beta-hydroxyacid dehydrogenase